MIPFGLIVLLMAVFFLKADEEREGRVTFDLLGMLFSSLGLDGGCQPIEPSRF